MLALEIGTFCSFFILIDKPCVSYSTLISCTQKFNLMR
jgi:hypothetical protein